MGDHIRNRTFWLRSGLVAAALVAMPVAVSPAQATTGNHYGVTISTKPTRHMAFANGVYSSTADNAVLNVNDLTNALAAGNVEVTTGNGSGGDEKGDVHIDAGFTWVSSFGLTLDAYRTIFVNQAVVDAGTGALTLTNNDGGSGGVLAFGPSGSVTIWSLTDSLTINGQRYTLVADIKTLGSDIAANPSGNFALASTYDASKDGTYSNSVIATFVEGTVEGLGNAVTNLAINVGNGGVPSGLFSGIGSGGAVVNLNVWNANLSINSRNRATLVGALTGVNDGVIFDDHSSGMVAATNYKRDPMVGGLVGGNTGTLMSSSSSAQVVGGEAGGLAGVNGGTIDLSSASGPVTGHGSMAGGLVGWNAYNGLISQCFAVGNVRGNDRGTASGGLVGVNVDFDHGINATTTVTNSYATGKVVGGQYVGGLSGSNNRGDGSEPAIVEYSYSTGGVSDGANIGGLLGSAASTMTDDYWDTKTSGTKHGVEGGNVQGVTGLTTAQLQSGLPSGFDPNIWAENPSINNGLPYLIANPPPN